ncbi:hypothetical protein OUZ56_011400 [Daphnia magna]|uniref:Uncharacterized protein n=1 Tax=Daphnia magna TaxID=35525 RepID=A0ABQ9YZZ8_9CRUS|nr:hypothetical protein OUZ56_011400 [Daphnia magna]
MTELPHEQPGKTKVGKKFILDQMLDVLDQTEEIYKDTGSRIKMFASITTIRGWRLSVRSAIALIEEQFNAGFDFVLTGKWNQDPLERLFGIIRSVNSHPSVTSWLQIERFVTLITFKHRETKCEH